MLPGALQGYSLGDSQLQFNITITIQTGSSVSASNQTLVLSPSTPLAASTDGAIVSQLLGDLAIVEGRLDEVSSMLGSDRRRTR